MLHQLFNLPHNEHFYLACSGGVDSMSVADFYKRGGKLFSLLYFNHGTPQSNDMQTVVENFGVKNNVQVKVGHIQNTKPKELSPEEYWRIERYHFFAQFYPKTIVTCHHLNDVAETWIFYALNGNPKLIAAKRDNYLRPFLTTTKAELIKWAKDHQVEWLEDKSNQDVRYPRNRIRNNILPEALQVNPGLLKVLKKKILAREKGKLE